MSRQHMGAFDSWLILMRPSAIQNLGSMLVVYFDVIMHNRGTPEIRVPTARPMSLGQLQKLVPAISVMLHCNNSAQLFNRFVLQSQDSSMLRLDDATPKEIKRPFRYRLKYFPNFSIPTSSIPYLNCSHPNPSL